MNATPDMLIPLATATPIADIVGRIGGRSPRDGLPMTIRVRADDLSLIEKSPEWTEKGWGLLVGAAGSTALAVGILTGTNIVIDDETPAGHARLLP